MITPSREVCGQGSVETRAGAGHWPALDVPVSRLVVDAGALREGAANAEPYWPDAGS